MKFVEVQPVILPACADDPTEWTSLLREGVHGHMYSVKVGEEFRKFVSVTNLHLRFEFDDGSPTVYTSIPALIHFSFPDNLSLPSGSVTHMWCPNRDAHVCLPRANIISGQFASTSDWGVSDGQLDLVGVETLLNTKDFRKMFSPEVQFP